MKELGNPDVWRENTVIIGETLILQKPLRSLSPRSGTVVKAVFLCLQSLNKIILQVVLFTESQ